MVQVRMKTIYAGPNGNCQPGGIISVDEVEAVELVNGRYAEYVETLSNEETEPDDENGKNEFPEDIKKLGGGYFELPNGEKVRGKDKALAAYHALTATQ